MAVMDGVPALIAAPVARVEHERLQAVSGRVEERATADEAPPRSRPLHACPRPGPSWGHSCRKSRRSARRIARPEPPRPPWPPRRSPALPRPERRRRRAARRASMPPSVTPPPTAMHRTPAADAPAGDAERRLAERGLLVDPALAGDHDVRPVELPSKPVGSIDELDAGPQREGPEEPLTAEEREAGAAGGAGARCLALAAPGRTLRARRRTPSARVELARPVRASRPSAGRRSPLRRSARAAGS